MEQEAVLAAAEVDAGDLLDAVPMTDAVVDEALAVLSEAMAEVAARTP